MGKERKLSNEFEVVPPFVCSVRIGGQSVNVFSDFSGFLHFFTGNEVSYPMDIPGWEVSSIERQEDPSIFYYPARDTEFSYLTEQKVFVIKGRIEDFEDGQALAYASFWLSEAERQRGSVFTVHAAALSMNDKGILLVGDRGSGKTSITLGLLERFDGQLAANDLTILRYDTNEGQAFLEGGSKMLRLRFASIKSRFPHLLSFFADKNDDAPWLSKALVDPKQLGISVIEESKLLSTAFTVHLDSDPNEPLIVTRLSGIEVQFELYENLSRIIRGSAISVFGSDKNILGYMPSLDDEDTHKKRVELINYLTQRLGVWHVSGGNLDQICEVILKMSKS